MYRLIGRYRRSVHRKSPTSLEVALRLLYVHFWLARRIVYAEEIIVQCSKRHIASGFIQIFIHRETAATQKTQRYKITSININKTKKYVTEFTISK